MKDLRLLPGGGVIGEVQGEYDLSREQDWASQAEDSSAKAGREAGVGWRVRGQRSGSRSKAPRAGGIRLRSKLGPPGKGLPASVREEGHL